MLCVPALEARIVQSAEELLPAEMEEMEEQPECMLMPVPDTERATERAVVPPLFWMLRSTSKVEPSSTFTEEGVTETEREGGSTTLKSEDSALDGEPRTLIFTLICVLDWVWEMLAVVQVTVLVPSLKDLDVPSPEEKPVGVSTSVTVPLFSRPETVIVKAVPFISVPLSAPDWETVTVAACTCGRERQKSRMGIRRMRDLILRTLPLF
jgi:hypothetical protein